MPNIPDRAVETNNAAQQPPAPRPCKVCETQLRLQWAFTAHSLYRMWINRPWRARFENTSLWGAVSIGAVIGLVYLSEEPYNCGAVRHGGHGRHVWGRAVEGGIVVLRLARDGTRDLAAWAQDRLASMVPDDGDRLPTLDEVREKLDKSMPVLNVADDEEAQAEADGYVFCKSD